MIKMALVFEACRVHNKKLLARVVRGEGGGAGVLARVASFDTPDREAQGSSPSWDVS